MGEEGRKSQEGLPGRMKRAIRVGGLDALMEPGFPWKEK